ncbi:MAG: hypothetical protein Q9180_007922, partial [Flavoplaca navasiana]
MDHELEKNMQEHALAQKSEGKMSSTQSPQSLHKDEGFASSSQNSQSLHKDGDVVTSSHATAIQAKIEERLYKLATELQRLIIDEIPESEFVGLLDTRLQNPYSNPDMLRTRLLRKYATASAVQGLSDNDR